MDNTPQTLTTAAARSLLEDTDGDEEADVEEPCDLEAWETLRNSFKEVQSVLDRNRRLIQLANDNHMSKIPHSLAKNVDLIREINANISRVVRLYSDLSEKFSGIVHERRVLRDKAAKDA
ncbi:Protein ELF4-LIKE 1 [Striga hermonthica]|uniref:Protein ELF4-LIKE 1 n=1 Tax=Striga hermonthica TaxID=68872 RepID=A0A9N7NTE7_STRHE|nr:Protein ELF4-LIKE 1 [Striga hermonthica]